MVIKSVETARVLLQVFVGISMSQKLSQGKFKSCCLWISNLQTHLSGVQCWKYNKEKLNKRWVYSYDYTLCDAFVFRHLITKTWLGKRSNHECHAAYFKQWGCIFTGPCKIMSHYYCFLGNLSLKATANAWSEAQIVLPACTWKLFTLQNWTQIHNGKGCVHLH